MGNNLPAPSQSNFLAQITENYVQIRRNNQGVILGKKDEEHTFILKEFSFVNQQQFKQKFSSLEDQLKRGPKDYLTNIVRVQSQTFNNFCSTSFKVYAIFEYPQVSLKEQILARSKEGKCFEEGQLWSILQSCTNALSELKPSISLVPSQIFINAEGSLKIIHNDLIDENYRSVPTSGVYYAPQKLKNFFRIDSELTLRKQSIFSMGMTILQAALLEDLFGCYDVSSLSFSEVQLMAKIQSIYNRYSPEFNQIICNILQVNPNRRASLMEIQKILDNYWTYENGEERNSTDLRESSCSNNQMILNQENEQPRNKGALTQKNENVPIKNSLNKSQKNKQRDLTLPDEISSYKLQKPINDPVRDSLITPKNPPASRETKGIYTDPRLLEMIKKDLEDISRLKQSAFYETGKYTSNYSQMQGGSNLPVLTGPYCQVPYERQQIINNKNQYFQTARDYNEEKVDFTREKDYSSVRIDQRQGLIEVASNNYGQPSVQPTRQMMKKNNQDNKVFIVETYQNGNRYEGMSLFGKKHGKGRLIFEDGAYYEGDFKEDRMTGKGVLYYRQGQPAYDGEWLDDHFHGQGVLFNQTPQPYDEPFDFRDFNNLDDFWIKYQGGFEQDKKQGVGRLSLTNGQIFEGQFVNDFVEGNGNFSNIQGVIVRGTWENNLLNQID